MGKERRESVRVGIKPIPAVIAFERIKAQGDVLSLAKKGLFVRCLELPDVGALVHVAFKTERKERLEVAGHVTWNTNQLRPGTYRNPGFGMKFSDWNQDYHEYFERVLFSTLE